MKSFIFKLICCAGLAGVTLSSVYAVDTDFEPQNFGQKKFDPQMDGGNSRSYFSLKPSLVTLSRQGKVNGGTYLSGALGFYPLKRLYFVGEMYTDCAPNFNDDNLASATMMFGLFRYPNENTAFLSVGPSYLNEMKDFQDNPFVGITVNLYDDAAMSREKMHATFLSATFFRSADDDNFLYRFEIFQFFFYF